MDARQSWLWILAILILNLISTTSSEIVKRQDAEAADEEQNPVTVNNLLRTKLPFDVSIKPFSKKYSSYDIPSAETNEEPLSALRDQTPYEPKNDNTKDLEISKVSNEEESTQTPSYNIDVSRPLQIMEQHINSESPEVTANRSTSTFLNMARGKDDISNEKESTQTSDVSRPLQIMEQHINSESPEVTANRSTSTFLNMASEKEDIDSINPRILQKNNSEVSERDIELDTIVPKNNLTAAVVHEMLETIELRNSTYNYVTKFNRRYALLPVVEADNLKWTKFSRAVAETFVLDFSRMYDEGSNLSRNSSLDSDDNDDWDEDDPLDYNETYNLAISHLKEKNGQTALQFAVPVRRTADIYRAVLDMPIGIVQSKCKDYMSIWQCHAEYLAKLTDESEICDDIWHHAELYLKILKTLEEKNNAEDPVDIIIAELESKIKSVKKNNSKSLLNFIIKTLRKLRSRIKEPLISNAQVFNYVKDSQRKGLLKCMIIDQALE